MIPKIEYYGVRIMTFFALCYIAFVVYCAYIFVRRKANTAVERLGIVLFLCSFALYSGVGIATGKCNAIYILSFSVFLFFLAIGLNISLNTNIGARRIDKTKKVDFVLLKYAKAATVVYILICIFLLFYPENKIIRTLSSSIGILQGPSSQSSNIVVRILNMVQYLLTPFLYVNMANTKKWYTPAIIQLSLIAISFFGGAGYLARSGLTANLFILVFISISEIEKRRAKTLYDRKKFEIERWRLFRRYLRLGVLALIAVMPLFYAYTILRTGATVNWSEIPSLFKILEDELNFAMHYPYCVYFSNQFNPFRYFIWLVTLPIPIFEFNGMQLNTEYSQLFVPAYYGVNYKTVVLPGLLGEGLLLYGEYFFWIHALFLGLIYGYFLKYYSCSENRRYLGVFFVAQIVLSTRGGSQSVIAQFINYGLLMFFCEFVNIKTGQTIKR